MPLDDNVPDHSDDSSDEHANDHIQGQEHESGLFYYTQPSRRHDFRKSIDSASEGACSVEEKRELVRIETCAVFHKLTPGPGVPHSFIGFVRQWPSLPRVVVSILTTTCFHFRRAESMR